METAKSVFVNGLWNPGSGEPFESIDPVRGTTCWRGAAASAGDVDDAFDSARRAFGKWYRLGSGKRAGVAKRFAEILRERRLEIARGIAFETGKALWDCEQELAAAVNKIDISIRALHERTGKHRNEESGTCSELRHKPHGVVAVFGPFNFPVHLPNGHIVPALLAGNSVVFKPSELAPGCASLYAECWREAGLPAGVLNVVNGARDTGEAIVDHPGLDGLFFTGSVRTGETIHRRLAGMTGRMLALELGGNNPLVLTRATDADAAVLGILQSAYVTAGQRCTCARRLIVIDDPANRDLIDRLVSAIDRLEVGDPLSDPQPFYGSLVNPDAAASILSFQDQLVALGAKPIRACRPTGTAPAVLRPGIVDVTGIDNIPDEEAFGPLLQLRWVSDLDEAIDHANRTRFGLSAGIFCEAASDWDRFLIESRAGIVNRNLPLTGASSALPFGGIGASGNLRPSAYYAADYCAYPVSSLVRDELRLPESLPPGVVL